MYATTHTLLETRCLKKLGTCQCQQQQGESSVTTLINKLISCPHSVTVSQQVSHKSVVNHSRLSHMDSMAISYNYVSTNSVPTPQRAMATYSDPFRRRTESMQNREYGEPRICRTESTQNRECGEPRVCRTESTQNREYEEPRVRIDLRVSTE